MTNITPDLLLKAYRAGVFPMAEDAESAELFWFDPPERTIFPLYAFHVPARLRRTIRQRPYRLTVNQDFGSVIRACAAPRADRDKTWINAEIIELYTALHQQGKAHSLEAWQGDQLMGGLYGVQIGGAFFGESMFSTMTDASKISLVALVALLRHQKFQLLDCQFMTSHLSQFGAITISRSAYQERLEAACAAHCFWGNWGVDGVAMGGTYPGTGTGNPSAAGLATGVAGVDGVTNAGVVVPTGASGAAVTLDAVLMGFLQEITQTS